MAHWHDGIKQRPVKKNYFKLQFTRAALPTENKGSTDGRENIKIHLKHKLLLYVDYISWF